MVRLVSHNYSFFSKTQFIIIIALAIILVLGIWDIVAHAASHITTTHTDTVRYIPCGVPTPTISQ